MIGNLGPRSLEGSRHGPSEIGWGRARAKMLRQVWTRSLVPGNYGLVRPLPLPPLPPLRVVIEGLRSYPRTWSWTKTPLPSLTSFELETQLHDDAGTLSRATIDLC